MRVRHFLAGNGRADRQTDYAIRVLLALAKQGDETLLPTSQIQQEMLIPKALSLRVVAELAKGGFIVTYPVREGAEVAASGVHDQPAPGSDVFRERLHNFGMLTWRWRLHLRS